MGHDHHDHGHGHHHGAGSSTRRLALALALTSVFLIAELVGAYLFDSLALLSDAAHMFTDSAALAIALAAVRIGQRPPDELRTFGYRRFEILAAALNAVLLLLVAVFVLVEGVKRFFDPQPVGSLGMLAVACAGLVVNLISMRILAGGRDESLNVKGAYLEVWADMLGSLGVIAAAITIYFTRLDWIDPMVAIAIGLWVLPRTWKLLGDTTHILLQGVPRGFDLAAIRQAMGEVEGVSGVHDLHLWSVAGNDASFTAHVALADGADAEAIRKQVTGVLRERFNILDITLQVEAQLCGDLSQLHR